MTDLAESVLLQCSTSSGMVFLGNIRNVNFFIGDVKHQVMDHLLYIGFISCKLNKGLLALDY